MRTPVTYVRTALVALLMVVFVGSPSASVGKESPPPATARITGLRIETGRAVESDGEAVTTLAGREARQQLVVTGASADGRLVDLTDTVTYTTAQEGVVAVDASGMVTPLADGRATIKAAGPDGVSASAAVVVTGFGANDRVDFARQVVPIFTKLGCNSGACHGKAQGQNGFRLSLLGFEPREDYEHLVRESRGRRLFPAAPEQSVLLLKPTGAMPHKGGRLIEPDSQAYRLIHQWIAQGMPARRPDDPIVTRVAVVPADRTMQAKQTQQLAVTAHYSDGATEDVTRWASYESNDREMAEVGKSGRVRLLGGAGGVAVMIRYRGQMAVFRATVPLGAPVDGLPEPRNFIDELVFGKLKKLGMPPSPACDDATFCRRICLDIAGRLPTPAETETFLADTKPNKRDAWIDALLAGTDYADYFANKWSALLRNRRSKTADMHGTYAFHAWLRESFLVNKPYDRLVREIVTASGDIGRNPPVAWYRQVRDAKAQMEDTAQLFLGVRMQCARCHHHPFEKWSQQDYYGFTAFYSRVGRKAGAQPGEELIFHRRGQAQAMHPRTKKPVKPAGLGAEPVRLTADHDPRHTLVDWMIDKDNPFFAHVLVNRYWKHFFGRGLVEPEDDMRATNPATNPELLEALAKHFVAGGFDLKDLIRTICRSHVYQRTALPNEYNASDRQNFSRYYPKRLPAEVLLDAIDSLTGVVTSFDGVPGGTRVVQLPDNAFNEKSYFLKVFGRPDMKSACECERTQDASLAQSLHLLNSKDVLGKLTADNGRAAVLAGDKKRSVEDRVRELYLRAYSRPPADEELGVARKHIETQRTRKVEAKEKDGKKVKDDPDARERHAYEDILWALVNSKEFLFNH